MSPKPKKIWIDFDNSPHVIFFRPIIDRLREKGYTVVLTARDCFQTIGLADMFGMKYHKIGKHFGKKRVMKLIGLFYRSFQLIPFAMREKPDLAVSHGSRSMHVVANMLGINAILMFDYEFAGSVIITRPRMFMAPEIVVSDAPKFMEHMLIGYPGIKEDVYVPLFSPEKMLRSQLGIADDEILITIRPPATEAHYHNPESEPIFEAIVERCRNDKRIRAVILPRGDHQKIEILQKWADLFESKKLQIPSKVVDGLNLIWYSDVVISGGGTMNREAAALNVPVYSIFRGKLGAIDRYLSEQGRLHLVTSTADVPDIKIEKREISDSASQHDQVTLNFVVDTIAEAADKSK